MKRILLVLAFCFMTYGINVQAEEAIQMDSIPVLEVNQNVAPKIINTNTVHYESLIAPAKENNPTLIFNLSNIKNIKKGAILPNENQNQTLSDVSQYFNAPYDKVFSHLLSIADSSDLEVVSYDSRSGRIYANYRHEKPVYITVSQYNRTNVLVKITPADGVYDLPQSVTGRIFAELNRSLAAN